MNTATDVISFTEVALTKEGFSYWGNAWVDFKLCAFNVKNELGNGHVGWRCIDGPVPYFEFAGDKRVIVTFPTPSWIDRLFGRDFFHAFQFKLRELGWRTFDRS